MSKKYPTIAVCGLDCGLCPRYYTSGQSRCPGCAGPNFAQKHPACGLITCCVKQKQLEVCSQCAEFPCPKVANRLDSAEDSFVTYQNVRANHAFIKEKGLSTFLDVQAKRIALLEQMLANFDDGRSRTFYCNAATLLSLKSLEAALGESSKSTKGLGNSKEDLKEKARILKDLLAKLAAGEGVDLALRKGNK